MSTCAKELQLSVTGSDVFAYFKCDETTGESNLVDSVTGLLWPGDVLSVAGKINGAVRIEPSYGFQTFPSSDYWTLDGTSWTVRFWAKFTHTAANVPILNNNTKWFFTYEDSVLTANVFDTGPGTPECVTAITDGVWHRIVLWYDEGVEIGLKIDNDATITDPSSGVISPSTSSRLTVAAVAGGFDFDELGIWKRKLSDAELLTDWNSGNGLTWPNIP